MEARQRKIKSGAEYNRHFTKASGNFFTIKKDAELSDTLVFIPKVVAKTLNQTKAIADLLKGNSVYETCSNIWHFVYNHIQYKKDKQGYEQIRSPSRTWHDRFTGVDCDCYSVFISSILTNLRIPHILRITKYRKDYFQHIYPLVPFNGKYITLDCVTNAFDFEVPYSEKKDYPMELQFLDGIPSLYGDSNDLYLMGADDGEQALNNIIERNLNAKKPYVYDDQTLGLFGSRKRKKAAAAAAAASAATSVTPGALPSATPAPAPKKKKGFLRKLSLRKVLNVVNKVNPATVLLRNGLLAAMKLNISNVAKRLRWAYLNPSQAAAKNIDAAKHQRLVATKDKLEKIFEGAGGKPSNLRKAILSGKGNKDKGVQGIDGLGTSSFSDIDRMNTYTPLPELLGEIYYSENIEGLNGVDLIEGLGELGEPISMAAITAAMGAVTAIAASLKQIGNIFKGKGEGSQDFDEKLNEAAEKNQPVPDTTPVPTPASTPALPKAAIEANAYSEASTATSNSNTALKASYNNAASYEEQENASSAIAPVNNSVMKTSAGTSQADISEDAVTVEKEANTAAPTSDTSNAGSNTPTQPSFWDKNKKWIKPVAIVGGGIAIVAIGYSMFKNNRPQNKSSPQQLSGVPGKKKKHHRKSKSKIKSVALI